MVFHFEILFLEYRRFEVFENGHLRRSKKCSWDELVFDPMLRKIKVVQLGLYAANSWDRLFLHWMSTLSRDRLTGQIQLIRSQRPDSISLTPDFIHFHSPLYFKFNFSK